MNTPKITLAIKALPLLLLAMVALSSCAGQRYPLSKCDGYSARPTASQRQSLPFASKGKPVASFSESNVTASYRDCGTGSWAW